MRFARSRNALTVLALMGVVAAMSGLVAASVPLYELFCRVTGYGGTTRVGALMPLEVADRAVTVRFDANTGKGLPWRFEPVQPDMTVRVGESALAWYRAENLSDETVVGQAVYNVAPAKAGSYFAKVDCFCFVEQVLAPGESIDMPVSFYVDPAMVTDENTQEITTITLSYTFFRARGAAVEGAGKDKERDGRT